MSTPKPTKLLYVTPGRAVVWLLSFILFVPVIVYRYLLKFCTKYLRPDLSHMLRHNGGVFLRESVDREPNMNIVLAFHVDGLPDIGDIKHLVHERLLKARSEDGQKLAYPELQQYCVKWAGYFFWKAESTFRIHDHIRIHELTPKEDVKVFQTEYLREPLPALKSPWEILVVAGGRQHGDDDTPSYHIFFKFHHSLSDGYSIFRLIMLLVDSDTPIVCLEPPKYIETTATAGKLERCLYWATLAIRFIQLITTTRTYCLPWPELPPEPPTGGLRKQHLHAGGGQIVQLAKVRQIAKQHFVSTSAVLYAALTGALRRNLSKYSPEKIPSHVSYLQPVPVSQHPKGLCNVLCGVTYRLPIGENSPSARLHGCEQMIRESKESMTSQISKLVLEFRGLLPYTFPFLYDLSDPEWMYLETSNMPGPLKPCKFNGQFVLGIDFQLLSGPCTFFMSMLSYNGVLRWTCNGDTRVFTKGELVRLGEAVREELEALETVEP